MSLCGQFLGGAGRCAVVLAVIGACRTSPGPLPPERARAAGEEPASVARQPDRPPPGALVGTRLAGPHDSIDALCAALETSGREQGIRVQCATDHPSLPVPPVLPSPRPPIEALAFVHVEADVAEAGHHVALAVSGGWYLLEHLATTGRTSDGARSAEIAAVGFRDVAGAPGDELVVEVQTAREDAQVASWRRALLVCGVGPSGAPSCIEQPYGWGVEGDYGLVLDVRFADGTLHLSADEDALARVPPARETTGAYPLFFP